MSENFRPSILRAKARETLKGKWNWAALLFLISGLIISVMPGFAFKFPSADLSMLPSEITLKILACYIFYIAFHLFISVFITIGISFVFLDVFKNCSDSKLNYRTVFEPFRYYFRYLKGVILLTIYLFLWTSPFLIEVVISYLIKVSPATEFVLSTPKLSPFSLISFQTVVPRWESVLRFVLLIPFFVKIISYGLTFFIMRDNPDITPTGAISKSVKMMDGHKLDYMLLMFSFLGWVLLMVLPMVILMICNLLFMDTTSLSSHLFLINSISVGLLIFYVTAFWLSPYIYTANAAFYNEVKADYEQRTAGAQPQAM